MYSINKKVLLCSGATGETESNENQYKKCLSDSGIDSEVLQVLTFEFIDFDSLRNELYSYDKYAGLILTSPRAATAIAMINMRNNLVAKAWLDQPIFCVGQATESVIRELVGLKNISGTDTGNAKNLAKFIIETMKDKCTKPFLLPCSNIARDTIPKMLSDNGMEVKKVVVYETKANKNLKQLLNDSIQKSPDVLVFFSPSIVENMISVLDNDKSFFEKCKIVAIGPVTEQALRDSGIHIDGVSEKPEPKSLTEIIQKVIS